jgi:hypothetical protein
MRIRTRARTSIGLTIAATVALGSSARADGIDIFALVASGLAPGRGIQVIAMIALAMVINYAINFAVIGLPVIKLERADPRSVARGLVALTLLGQLADRAGIVLGLALSGPLADPIARTLGLHGEGASFMPIIALTLLCSAVAVGALAYYFVRRRWHVSVRLSCIVAIAAAVLTNPVWMLIIASRMS